MAVDAFLRTQRLAAAGDSRNRVGLRFAGADAVHKNKIKRIARIPSRNRRPNCHLGGPQLRIRER
jgi:hypothetical protein